MAECTIQRTRLTECKQRIQHMQPSVYCVAPHSVYRLLYTGHKIQINTFCYTAYIAYAMHAAHIAYAAWRFLAHRQVPFVSVSMANTFCYTAYIAYAMHGAYIAYAAWPFPHIDRFHFLREYGLLDFLVAHVLLNDSIGHRIYSVYCLESALSVYILCIQGYTDLVLISWHILHIQPTSHTHCSCLRCLVYRHGHYCPEYGLLRVSPTPASMFCLSPIAVYSTSEFASLKEHVSVYSES